ncbi:TonB-dependent receptor domain-containing protein [Chondrinema litorale]|uniref:TonB-dependent receptor domain-containing protein n=1 Tax=Chondrinema litorale TaxID=2994555 RepID=UPI002542E84F|nr:TonB-dependent receptor [Chondrinema litorale]UZR95647.1 TonB-dependent receptor [Chondrinema litorale]
MKITFTSLFCLFSLISFVSKAQIKGKVFDLANNQGITGATITFGKNEGAVTNEDGYFSIEATQNIDSITISSLGYISQQLALKNQTSFLQIGLEENVKEISEVLITAFRGKQKLLNIPAAVTFISPAELHRDDDVNIAPVLNRVPGVYMHIGAYNTNRITIRGIGARSLYSTAKVRAYLNEIPLTNGIGETTLEDIDMSLLSRMEVIKGPAASEYGAGLGGTILMQTAKSPYRRTSLSSQLTVGSYGLYRNTNAFKTGNDKANISVVHNLMHSDGFRENNQYDRQSITSLAEFYAGENTTVNVLASVIDLKAYIPSSIDSATFAGNPKAAAANWGGTRGFEDSQKGIFGVALHQRISDNFSNSTSVFSGFRNAYELRPFNILREGNTNFGGRTSFSFINKDLSFIPEVTLGAEFYNERYAWQTYENNERETGAALSDNEELRKYYNLFLKTSFRITNKLQATAGLNLNKSTYDYIDYFADDVDLSGKYEFEAILSPRLAFNYQWKENITFYAGVSHGFSPPTLEETLTPEGQINPEIQPERGMNYELGNRGSLLNNRLFYDITAYSMRIKDLLVARRTAADAYVGVNAGKTTHNGLEASLQYQLVSSENKLFKQASIFSSLALNDYVFDEFVDETNDYSGNELTGVPKSVFNAGVDVEMYMGLYVNINLLSVGSMPITDNNAVYSDAYKVVNSKIGYKKLFFSKLELDVYAGVNNLFDEKYASMISVNATGFGASLPRYYYPGFPRNYYTSVSLKYFFN